MANFTEKAIKASFIKLLNEQPLNKISVKSIVEDCGINRNSFYYHFQDIPALAEAIVIDQTDQLIQKYPSISSFEECFRVAFRYALENRRAIKHIYDSLNHDIFIRNVLKLCESAVTSYINTAFSDTGIDDNDRAIVIRFLKCQLFGLIIEWVSSGMPEDAMNSMERMIELCRDIPDRIIARSLERDQD